MSCSTPWSRRSNPEQRAARGQSYLRALRAVAACLALGGVVALAGTAPPAAPRWLAQRLPDCHLAGRGSFRWWGIRIYSASLWVGAQGLDPARLDARPFALQLHYAHALSGATIAEASARLIARLDLGSKAQRAQWLQDMRRIFPDVRAGQRLAGVYRLHPERTVFFLDGKAIGQVAGAAFARAFFAIWLSPRSSLPALQRALTAGLGKTA